MLFISVESDPLAYRAGVVVVFRVELFHVVAESHLLGEVLAAADAFLVYVLRAPGAVLVFSHVLDQVNSRAVLRAMLFQGEVFAAILTNQTSSWVFFYPKKSNFMLLYTGLNGWKMRSLPVINELIRSFGVELFVAVSALPLHVSVGLVFGVLFFAVRVPLLPGPEPDIDPLVLALFAEPCIVSALHFIGDCDSEG